MKNKYEQYAKLKSRKKELEKEVKDINQELQELNDEIIEAWQEDGINKLSLDEIGTLYINKSTRASCLNPDTFHAFLKETGQEAMIKTSVPHQTLGAWVRKQLEDDALNWDKQKLENLGLKIYEQYDIRLRSN